MSLPPATKNRPTQGGCSGHRAHARAAHERSSASIDAGVSPSLVHYHFDSREALLAEALDYSYTHAGDARISSGELPARSGAERLRAMIAQCLPTTPALPICRPRPMSIPPGSI